MNMPSCLTLWQGTRAKAIALCGIIYVALYSNTPWQQLAMAFHFSPDGSFYHVSDEGTILKIAVTVDVKDAVTKHKIPIDGGGYVQIVVDGIPQTFVVDGYEAPFFVNEHRIVELDFSPGRHTLELVNYSGPYSEQWTLMVVGKCLWGTDKNITFVKAGL